MSAFCGVRISTRASVMASAVFDSWMIATTWPFVGAAAVGTKKLGMASSVPPMVRIPVVTPMNACRPESEEFQFGNRCPRNVRAAAPPLSPGGTCSLP
jgi:hypothetical protein